MANTCNGEIVHERVGEYVGETLAFAASLPQVDTSRIYAIGWSHGGAGVLAWLQSLGRETLPTVAGSTAEALLPK